MNTDVELQVNFHAGLKVQDIKGGIHPITVKQLLDGSYNIRISKSKKGMAANQEFILNWRPELGAGTQPANFTQQVNGDE